MAADLRRAAATRWPGNSIAGSSQVELLIVAPLLVLLGLGIVQLGFVYHARAVLNHATFEAARVGAVEHGLEAPMRRELDRRLVALAVTSASKSARAASAVDQRDRPDGDEFTVFALRNPTRQAFEDWAVFDEEEQTMAIPNVHLQHRDAQRLGKRSGMSLQEANVLEIGVVHGHRLRVPLVNRLVTQSMAVLDPDHIRYYRQGLVPLRAVARVRMHSSLWEQSLIAMADPDQRPPDAFSGDGSLRPPDAQAIDHCNELLSSESDQVLLTEADLFGMLCEQPGQQASGSGLRPPPTLTECP